MKDSAGTWNTMQVNLFVKRIAQSDEGQAWWSFHPKLREAIISHHVLMTVLSLRESEAICVDDMRELRIQIEERLASHHNLKVAE